MQTVWHLLGAKAGQFDQVSDEQARKLEESGEAQIVDGGTPLKYPENHPNVQSGLIEKPKRRRKYKTKVMTPEIEPEDS